MWQSIGAFFGRNAISLASICVAVASFVTAYTSLQYSIRAQKVDTEYKELSILPGLGLGYNNENYSYTIDNGGLGPAEIKRVVVDTGSECIDSADYRKNQPSFTYSDFQDKFRTVVGQHFVIGAMARIDKRYAYHAVPIVSPIVELMYILPGRSHSIFQYEKKTLEALMTFLEKEGLERINEFNEYFGKQSSKLLFNIEYCSLSGKTCFAKNTTTRCPRIAKASLDSTSDR